MLHPLRNEQFSEVNQLLTCVLTRMGHSLTHLLRRKINTERPGYIGRNNRKLQLCWMESQNCILLRALVNNLCTQKWWAGVRDWCTKQLTHDTYLRRCAKGYVQFECRRNSWFLLFEPRVTDQGRNCFWLHTKRLTSWEQRVCGSMELNIKCLVRIRSLMGRMGTKQMFPVNCGTNTT